MKQQSRQSYQLFTISSIALALLSFALPIAAQSCGDFVNEEIYEGELYVERYPIEICDNPFNADVPDPFDYTLTVYGESVDPGETVRVASGTQVVISYSITGTITETDNPRYNGRSFELWRKSGDDYKFIVRQPGFRGQSFALNSLESGEYVAVLTYETEPVLQVWLPAWLRSLLEKTILPITAYAQSFPDYQYIVAVPFTVVVEEPAPEGASSVLFLPGIQASKLYMSGGLISDFDTVWPPDELFNMDVRNLRMTEEGESIEDISTFDVLESVPGMGTIYGGFLDFLDDQKDAEYPIADYTAFPYDWRYDVFTVATEDVKYRDGTFKNLLDEVSRLADGSYTGKVTIIAHSNGGLVTKAFMSEYQDELEDKIDRIILIGSPQLGTPKAIGAMLHGYDETAGFTGTFKDGVAVREVINNMPGAYGLLPSEAYFDELNEPMITFDNSATTEAYRNRYGSEISSYDIYLEFLKGDDTLPRDMSDNLAIPVRLNEAMVDSSSQLHTAVLDDWIAPDSVEVIEIVGTGLPTMKSVEYRELTERKCTLGLFNCQDVVEMKPYASLTKYGDKTVTQFSAQSYSSTKVSYYVDLIRIRQGLPIFETRYDHANLTEASQIQQLISAILNESSDTPQFVTTNTLTFEDEYDVELMDSPVRMLTTDNQGRKTGIDIENGEEVLRLEIPNSDYFEFGGTKYLVIPSETDRVTELFGEDYGGYTLTVATLNELDEQEIKSQLKNATVTPTMIARYEKTNGEYSTLTTDLDGDGVFETEVLLDGTPVILEPPVVAATYESLIAAVKASELSRANEKVLLALIRSAEAASKKKHRVAKKLEATFLRLAEKTVEQYKRKRYLTADEADAIMKLIRELKY